MNHLDLFSGIGGFSLAVDVVWNDEKNTHIFCDNDKYCQASIRRHWPGSEIWGDIRELIKAAKVGRPAADPEAEGCLGDGEVGGFRGSVPEEGKDKEENQKREGGDDRASVSGELIANAKSGGECKSQSERDRRAEPKKAFGNRNRNVGILTGGFPCQPFSHAGRRGGKSDDRFLWPEMLECVRLFRPAWVIAENVYGLLSIERGLVFEQVCSDMEEAGYEVWPFVVPACAVNAPHRRDRVWIVAHKQRKRLLRVGQEKGRTQEQQMDKNRQKGSCMGSNNARCNSDAPDTTRFGGGQENKIQAGRESFGRGDWQRDWREVAFGTCVRGVDDGLPLWMDGVRISQAKQRTERLKMLGNSIVPQVAIEIMKAIKHVENGKQSGNRYK